nr:response regulator [Methylibium rhizosphaerae]
MATATNGLSALRSVNTFRPRVVIKDLQMSIMEGLEAARQMREQAWGRPMELIAASGQPPEVAQ